METFLWPGCAPDPHDGPRVAVVIPGAGYRAEAPLLYWPAEQLKDRGWHVRAIRWTDDDAPGDDPHGFAARAVEQAFEIDDADHSLQVPHGWRASQSAQAQAFTAVERFLADMVA